MTTLPAHLLDLAAMADRTRPRVRPHMAAGIAALMLMCLPRDEDDICLHRLAELDAAMHPRKGTW